MERQTDQLTTKGGHTVVLKAYLTAREMMTVEDKRDLSDSQKTQHLLGLAVVNLDGSADNLGEKSLDLPAADYLEIVKVVTATINPTKPENSAQPGSGTSTPAA
jgi:hypothetical protein